MRVDRPVPAADVARQMAPVRAALLDTIAEVLDSGRFVLGPKGEAFEEAFASVGSVGHAVSCSNGTAALYLALVASGVGSGDEVITVPNSFVATCEAIALTGATPVLVDIDQDGLIDPAAAAAAVTSRTAAVVPVHLHGQIVDCAALRSALGAGMPIVADGAQAHGGSLAGVPVGRLADVTTFSFYPSKNLGTVGEGGALVTGDPDIARRARRLRNHVGDARSIGFNWRLGEIEAAVLLVLLRTLGSWNEARVTIARRYDEILGARVAIPRIAAGDVYHHYVIQTDGRDALLEGLVRHSIEARVHYPEPIHRQSPFDRIARYGDLPRCERRQSRMLSLPIGPWMSDEDVGSVVGAVIEVLDGIDGPGVAS